jgi:hypothetical chaperone protein
MQDAAIGIDFGTTNSVVALARPDGSVTTRSFATKQGAVDAYRSALMFWREGRPPHSHVTHVSGPDALDMALGMTTEHRFLQSLKTHLSSRAFQETRLFGKLFRLEDLIAVFLTDLSAGLDDLGERSVLSGRPVVFAGDRPDEALALSRLSAAYGKAGMAKVDFAYEPLGAAYWYARELKTPQTMLVADFGGGTSDFSVMRFEPGASGTLQAVPLSHAGVGIAGDTFDYRIIEHAVSPLLGKGSDYLSFGKRLPIPAHYHAAFAQWHRLSLMKSRGDHDRAQGADPRRGRAWQARGPDDGDRIRSRLRALPRRFPRPRSRSPRRMRRSSPSTRWALRIDRTVTRALFERWIADDVAAIEGALDEALSAAGVAGDKIEAVFMTGGTSYVPAVRALFDRRFSPQRIHIGDAFRSVASGLALLALDRQQALAAA